MNRLSFLRALGATLAAVPLGLLAAKKEESVVASEDEQAISILKPMSVQFVEMGNGKAGSYLAHGNFTPVHEDGKLVCAEFRTFSPSNMKLIYDTDGYPRIVKA